VVNVVVVVVFNVVVLDDDDDDDVDKSNETNIQPPVPLPIPQSTNDSEAKMDGGEEAVVLVVLFLQSNRRTGCTLDGIVRRKVVFW
jgi:hypothetical protein